MLGRRKALLMYRYASNNCKDIFDSEKWHQMAWGMLYFMWVAGLIDECDYDEMKYALETEYEKEREVK